MSLVAAVALAGMPLLAACDLAMERPCRIEQRFDPTALEQLLGSRGEMFWTRGEELTLVARRNGDASLCCAVQGGMPPIGRGLYAMTVRVPRLQEAAIDVTVMSGTDFTEPITWRGSKAPPAPPKAADVWSLRTEHRIASAHLGQEREIDVYLPAERGTEPLPVIYMADGPAVTYAQIAEALRAEGKIRPVAVVGIRSAVTLPEHHACAPVCDPRSQEYLVGLEKQGASPEQAAMFARHERFVVEEVLPFVEARYPVGGRRENRAVAGYSSGSAWALAMVSRHPDSFGQAIVMSFARPRNADGMERASASRLFFGAGTLEPGTLLQRTREAEAKARYLGIASRLATPVAGHSGDAWELIFAEALEWLFPARGPRER